MNGWVKKRLGEVCTLQRGFDFPTRQRKKGDYPLISSSGCIDSQAEAKVNSPGVVTGRSGSIGSVFFIAKDFWPLNTTLYVKDFHGNDPRFIFHLLRKFDLKRFASGSGVPTLNRNSVHSELVYVPSNVSEQKRIVAILDEVFEGIDRAIANTEKNLANSHELFESYLNAIFTQKGDGWEEKKLGDICELISGQHIDAKDYNTNSQGIGYLTGPSDFGITHPIISKWTEVPKRTAVLNDILITVKGSGVGKINLLHLNEVAISRQLMAVRVEGQNIHFIYAFLSLQFSYFQSLANGAAIPGISRSDVLCLKIPIPSLDFQKEVVDSIEQYHCSTQRLDTIYRRKLAVLNELTTDTANQTIKVAQEVNAA